MPEIRDRIRELRRVHVSDLAPNPKNWRRHPEAQNSALLGILEEIGYAGALLAREGPDGNLILLDGHARAALTPDQEVPVLILDVTEEEGDRILASYDPIGALAETDREAQLRLLEEVGSSENERLQALFDALRDSGATMPKVGQTDPDALPTEVPTVAQPGDLWRLGEHRLLVGDCTNADDVAWLMGGAEARLVVTDPPYGVDYHSAKDKTYGARSTEGIANDALKGEDLTEFWRRAFAGLPLNGDCYVFMPSGPQNIILAQAIEAAGIEFKQWLIWVKNSLVLGRTHYHYRHEHIAYGWRGKSSWNGSRTLDSVWEEDRPSRSEDHPTMKPVALVERALEASSKKGNVVLDPFVGSGTTIIASERLGRRCYAMEIAPQYADVAIRRWEEFSGGKAEKS